MFRPALIAAVATTLAAASSAEAGNRHRLQLPGGVSVHVPSQVPQVSNQIRRRANKPRVSVVAPQPRIVTPSPAIVPQVRLRPHTACQTPVPTVRRINWRPIVPPAPTRTWYFGMSLQRIETAYGLGLEVATVTPGSPASRAGLEQGDVLLVAGNVSLQNAVSNEHGVQLVQSAVRFSPPAPTAAATYVVPQTLANLQLTVLDIRSGQLAYVNVQPQHVGSPTPMAAAPTRTF